MVSATFMITIKANSFMIYQIFCQNVIHQGLGILDDFQEVS